MADTRDGWCYICRGRPFEQCNHTVEDFDRACARRAYDIDALERKVESAARAAERARVLAAVEAEMLSLYHPDEAAETMASIRERLESP